MTKQTLIITICVIAIMVAWNVKAQVYMIQADTLKVDKTKVKPVNYVVVYLKYQDNRINITYATGLSMSNKSFWYAETAGFETIDAVINWLNTSNTVHYGDDEQIKARLKPEDLIGIYCIKDARKIELEFVKEKKVKEKHVEVEKKEWVNTSWRLK